MNRDKGIYLRLNDWELAHIDYLSARSHSGRSEWLRGLIRAEIEKAARIHGDDDYAGEDSKEEES